jgi:GTP cyclohydrolase II
MVTETTSKPPVYSFVNAPLMFFKHGDLSGWEPGKEQPMKLRSGLEFALFDVPYETPEEGKTLAAVAGRLEDLADLGQYPEGPLIRMHSACIFSEKGDNPAFDDVLSDERASLDDALAVLRSLELQTELSLECDCRAQREAAQALIAEQGGIYFDLMDQEGRGAGLEVKREAYRLHATEGLDTAEAYKRMGIAFDTRQYGHIARALVSAGSKRVRLLSNNPRKIAALEAYGIKVIPVRLVVGITGTNIEYLKVKRDKGGHILPPDEELEKLIG